jgi:hypothetical protein
MFYTATTKKGHVYYYCTNGKGKCEQHKKYTREKLADELVSKVFNEIKFGQEDIEIAYLASKEKILQQGNSSHTQQDQLAKQLKTAQDKLSNLADVISTDPSLKDSLKPKILSLEADIKSIHTLVSNTNEQTLDEALFTLEQQKTFTELMLVLII